MEQPERYKPPVSTTGPEKIKNSTLRRLGGHFRDADMQLIIGWILRTGVIASMAIVAIGGIFFVYRHGHTVPDYRTFTRVPGALRNPKGVFEGVFDLRGQAIIQAGILLLIATPVIRVIFSAIGFMLERDRLYTFISLLVLLIIVVSSITGHIG
ncbi:MAG: DUF1634 domain-containing protein [Bacteroidetes bacterium]|nr:DUF1634 domain-containing protein [Bacteroidota bacterium]